MAKAIGAPDLGTVDFDKGGKPEYQEKHPPVWLRSTDIKNAEVDSARGPVDHIEPA